MLVKEGGRYGDITKFKIEANGKDISQAILSVHIFQSIFEMFWTAEMFVSDTVNMKQLVKLKRGTKVKITVATDLNSDLDGEKTYEFVLQSINTGSYPNHQQSTYIISLMSDIIIADNSSRVCEVFKNQYQDQIIKKIVSQKFPGYSVIGHNTDTAITCIIPSWTPIDTIAWLTKSSTKAGTADFVFFQRDNKIFEFNSVYSMYMENESGVEFTRKPTNLTPLIGKYDYSFNAGRIFTEYYDVALEMMSGFYGSIVWQYDQRSKKMIKHEYKTSSQDRLWDAADPTENVIESANKSVTRYAPSMKGAFAQGKSIFENAGNWISNRIATLIRFDKNKVVIQTTGVAGAWKLLGQSCDVMLPSQQDRTDDMYDEEYAGRYLITGVTQMISRDSYMINYSLIKLKLGE